MLPSLDIAKRTSNDFSKLFYFTLPVKQLMCTRCAGMLRYEDETIPQRIKSSFQGFFFFFPWKVKRKVLSTFRLLGDNAKKAPSTFCHWNNFFFPSVSGNSRDPLLHAAGAGAGTHCPTVSHHSSCPCPSSSIRLGPEDGLSPKRRSASVRDVIVYLWFCQKNQAKPFSFCI